MQDIAVLVDLVELAREQGRTVEARIERAVLVRRASLDFNTSEHLVPACLRLGLHGFEIVLSQLFEVLHGLHLRYERRGCAHRYLLSAPGFETYPHEGVFAD